MGRVETTFERATVAEIRELFPGCMVLKGDSSNLQGVPDRLILFGDRWAALEFKASERSVHQPNQDYYVELMNEWSFAAFIFPGNKEEVLLGLQQALRPRRAARVSKR